jgi:hypothetical protein
MLQDQPVTASFDRQVNIMYCHMYVWLWTGFGLDWWIDLLTTYTNDSELQAITAPPVISTIHKSPQHQLSLFLACCVFTSRSLATASNSGDSSASGTQVLSSQPPVQNSTDNYLCPFFIPCQHGQHRKHISSIVAPNCCIIKNLLPINGKLFTVPLRSNDRCLQNHHLATGLYATVLYEIWGPHCGER